ncbi:MAG TPA: hypothetical protein VK451_04670, partial [Methyloceanibacter sp.]|nr:hypothetical protein [Methyloceanibacter sp.]
TSAAGFLSVMTRFPDCRHFCGVGSIRKANPPGAASLNEVFIACLSDAAHVSAAADHIPIHIAHA